MEAVAASQHHTVVVIGWCPNLIDPDAICEDIGRLHLEGDRFVSLDWFADLDRLACDELSRELLASYPGFLRRAVEVDWPAFRGRERSRPDDPTDAAGFMALCLRRSNVHVRAIHRPDETG